MYKKYIKRLLDIILSIILIIITFPLMIVVAFLLYINLGKPIWNQKRLREGLNKKTYTMYKFRTRIMYTYDKQLNEDQETYDYVSHVAYDKVLAVNDINSFIACPPSMPGASIAVKVKDSSLEPKYSKGDYVFIEFNVPLSNNDITLCSLNGKVMLKKYSNKEGKIVLSSPDKTIQKLTVKPEDKFYIIGKVLGK